MRPPATRRDPVARADRRRSAILHIAVGSFLLLISPLMPVLAVSVWLDGRELVRDVGDGPVAVGKAFRAIRTYDSNRGNKVVVTVTFTDRSGTERFGEVHEPECARDVDGKEVRTGARVRIRYDPSREHDELLAADRSDSCGYDWFDVVLTAFGILFGVALAAWGVRQLRDGLRDRAAATR